MENRKNYLKKNDNSFTLHDMPRAERPRERLLKYGADKLSSAELLALILNTGTKGESVLMISQKLIMQFGSLKGIMEASVEDLKQLKGMGEVKAAKLSASFAIAKKVLEEIRLNELNSATVKKKKSITSPQELYNIIKDKISNFSKEHFFVASLDARNNFIGIDEISVGTLTASIVHPRETFESAIKRHAAHIIIAHNHPSGETDPSEDDLKITKRLIDSGKIMGIEVLDHLIITQNDFLSFKEKMLM